MSYGAVPRGREEQSIFVMMIFSLLHGGVRGTFVSSLNVLWGLLLCVSNLNPFYARLSITLYDTIPSKSHFNYNYFKYVTEKIKQGKSG